MTQPMIVWCVIAGVLLCAFIFRAVEKYVEQCRNRDDKRPYLLEVGKEKEMFYVPGDFDDDNEFEDL